MSSTSAARRASRASSSVQQPRAPLRYVFGLRASARWPPVTSYPASTARTAATAESTPPDIAASTLTGSSLARAARAGRDGARAAGPLHGGRQGGGERLDVGHRAGVPQREAQ